MSCVNNQPIMESLLCTSLIIIPTNWISYSDIVSQCLNNHLNSEFVSCLHPARSGSMVAVHSIYTSHWSVVGLALFGPRPTFRPELRPFTFCCMHLMSGTTTVGETRI